MIRRFHRASYLAIASVIALGTVHAAPAAAQDAPVQEDAEGIASDEDAGIIVTARRREENLLDVPIAVTAYGAEALEESGSLDITDISDTTPNVRAVSRGADRSHR